MSTPLQPEGLSAADNIKNQLKQQYGVITSSSKYKYKYSKHLDTLFTSQANRLAKTGITSIYDIGVEKRPPTKKGGKGSTVLINKATGETLKIDGKEVTANKKVGGVNTWGSKNVKPGFAHFGVKVSEDGYPLFFPVWEDTSDVKKITQIVGIGAMFFAPALGAALAPTASAVAQGAIGGMTIGGATAGLLDQNILEGALKGAAGGALAGYFSGADAVSGAGESLGTGLTPGAGGTTGITLDAAGITGLTPPTGFALAPELGATLGAGLYGSQAPSIDLLSDTTFPEQGLKVPAIDSAEVALIPSDTVLPGEGLLAPTLPGITEMGGAQGLSVGVPGGTVSAAGFTPTGAVPVLGDPASFINDPRVLGEPVIGATDNIGGNLPIEDLIKGASVVDSLLNPPDQPMRRAQAGGMRPTGVDYSGLLNLLQTRVGMPNIAGLLSTTQPRYPNSLLG